MSDFSEFVVLSSVEQPILMPQLGERELVFYLPSSKSVDRMDEPPSLSVVDVYDMATEVGKEFEKIIDQYGPDIVQALVPRVIAVLERLEAEAMKNERESELIQELEMKIRQLESDRMEKAECRIKFEKELETLEETWTNEARDLGHLVSQLKQENARLASALANQPSTTAPMSPELDHGIVERLQKKVDSMREQNKKDELRITELEKEMENTQSSLDAANNTNKDLKRRLKSVKEQIVIMVGERADLQAELTEVTRQNFQMKQERVLSQETKQQQAPDMKNKLIYDADDPDRPRFTMLELKGILNERNDLKVRVSDLEDQVKRLTTPTSEGNNAPSYEEDEEEPPVQGPMPYEPEDAPWKRSESGMRRFFKKFFGDRWVSPQGSPARKPYSCPVKSPSSPSGFTFMVKTRAEEK